MLIDQRFIAGNDGFEIQSPEGTAENDRMRQSNIPSDESLAIFAVSYKTINHLLQVVYSLNFAPIGSSPTGRDFP